MYRCLGRFAVAILGEHLCGRDTVPGGRLGVLHEARNGLYGLGDGGSARFDDIKGVSVGYKLYAQEKGYYYFPSCKIEGKK